MYLDTLQVEVICPNSDYRQPKVGGQKNMTRS